MKYSKKLELDNLNQVRKVVSTASTCPHKVECVDCAGHVADASSILGMLALNFKEPVEIGCDHEASLAKILDQLD